jgi:NAD(P)-dependent dehydrogenase (short-subunit alcohol dehydrogenase family)
MKITRMKWGGRPVRALILAIFASVLITPVCHADTVLVTGANSGLGLELARQYAQAGWTVIAVHRRDTTPRELADLGRQYPKLRAERMDVADEAQVRELASKLKGVPIDVLINNAANTSTGEKQRFGQLDFKEGEDVLSTNILGPLRVSEAFLPQIEAGKQKKIVSITSTHASLTQPLAGSGAIFYRASKAGLNRAMLAVSEDLKPKGITVVLVHPGSVRKSRDEPATSAYGERVMVDVIAGTLIRTVGGLSMADTGHFIQYDGKALPW